MVVPLLALFGFATKLNSSRYFFDCLTPLKITKPYQFGLFISLSPKKQNPYFKRFCFLFLGRPIKNHKVGLRNAGVGTTSYNIPVVLVDIFKILKTYLFSIKIQETTIKYLDLFNFLQIKY